MIAESAHFERALEFQYLNEPDYVVRHKTGYNIIYIISFITFSHYNIIWRNNIDTTLILSFRRK